MNLRTWGSRQGAPACARPSRALHLLLTDLVMRVMTGLELAREISRILPAMTVLFMSAYSVEAAQDYEVWLAPGEPFLSKPFSIAILAQTVRPALNYEPPAWSVPSRG
ncbi:MAG TPA: response regulator [Methylomirabilota bacterium]|nr:response regulator [Methylomirabilota bacterium]